MTTELAIVPDNPLSQLSQARALLEASRDLSEVKSIRDVAIAAEHYARARKLGAEAERYAAEIATRAERRIGQILEKTPKAAGGDHGNQHTGGKSAEREDLPTDRERAGGYKVSARSQKLAAIPDDEFEDHMADQRKKASADQLARIQREREREQKREDNRALVEEVAPLEADPQALYQAIVIDPPWDWGDEGDADQLGRARPTYGTMSHAELLALPVGAQADASAHIYLWITNRSLPKGFSLLDAWGFRYVTMLTWCKPHFGMGNYYRGQTEQVLFGVRGRLPLLRRDRGTWFQAPRARGHSSKPDAFYELVEECSPGPWLEMFSRSARPGWSAWGAEA
jgi:N6-adenosine-specific RNA methylase IME4